MGLGGFQGVDQISDGTALGQALFGLMHGNAGQPFLAMNVLGIDGCAHQGLGRTRIDRHLFAPRPFPGQSRIARGLVQANVARNGGQRPDIQLVRRRQGEQQGNDIVSPRIGVDDQIDFLRRLGVRCGNQGQKQQTPEQLVQFLSIAIHGALLVHGKSKGRQSVKT
ncbi:hypothetical protein D3C78_959930 [compost metagenome]